MTEIEVIRLDEPMAPIILKFRRLPNFQDIIRKINKITKVEPTKLYYLDDEGDVISITTDVELQSAFLTLPLKLFFNLASNLPVSKESIDLQLSTSQRQKVQEENSPKIDIQTQIPPQVMTEKVDDLPLPLPLQDPTTIPLPLQDPTTIPLPTPITPPQEDPLPQHNFETKDERFEREVEDSLGQIINKFYDGDLQAKFISFFEEAKNWALSLPSELQTWRRTLVWVLEQIAYVVKNCGYTAELLIRTIGWTLETFSTSVLDRMRRDLNLLGSPEQTAVHPAQPEVDKTAEDLEEDAALKDLSKLEAMGWTDKKENIRKLQKHKGDLVACIDEYLST